MDLRQIIDRLESLSNPENVEGMARFGIRPKARVLGIPIPVLRQMAREIKKSDRHRESHNLALKLWDSKIHEAQILAGFIADPEKFTESQFEKWVKTFDSWDVVDQVCSACLDKTKFVLPKIFELANRKSEFEKRTAFTLMCCLAVHNKKIKDPEFLKFFPLIKKASVDERNFVKKAVNWALRQIGKRNASLNKKAVKLAQEILQLAQKKNLKGARWVANDAIRELTNEKVLKRLSLHEKNRKKIIG